MILVVFLELVSVIINYFIVAMSVTSNHLGLSQWTKNEGYSVEYAEGR